MELLENDHLPQKILNLNDKISEKINNNGYVFCRHCSNHGRYCAVADITEDERQKMIAIRDTLRVVHQDLVYLQRLKSNHERKREECYGRLDQSRKFLMERIQQFPEKEITKLGVLEELISFLEDVEQKRTLHPPRNDNNSNKFEMKTVDNSNLERGRSFLARTTRFALEFGVMVATIYSTVVLCKNIRQLNNNNNDNRLPRDSLSSSINAGHGVLQLGVLSGRG